MKKILEKILEKIIAYQTKKTPRADYLAHYYWGNQIWCFVPSVLVLMVLLPVHFLWGVNYWWLPLISAPFLGGYLAGKGKEKRDSTGLGNVDKKDIYYTYLPSFKQVFFLAIIIIIWSNI